MIAGLPDTRSAFIRAMLRYRSGNVVQWVFWQGHLLAQSGANSLDSLYLSFAQRKQS